MDLCIIGNRGHQGYVSNGLEMINDVNIVGVSPGTDKDQAGKIVELFGLKKNDNFEIYSDWRNMLKTLQPDIVSIAGPFESHTQMCVEAFRNKIHVFCEKPVALTLQELRKLRKAHEKAGVHFAHMVGIRYEPSFHTSWQTVKKGKIGKIRLINAQKSYKLGLRPPYYHRRETYGGTIPWVGIHAIDWIYWFTEKEFKTVYATHSTKDNQGHGDLESTALCHFTLTDDIYASVSIDFHRPSTAQTHGDDRIRIVGTRGVLEVSQDTVTMTNNQTYVRETLNKNVSKQIFQDFVEHVKGKSKGLIQAVDTFKVTEACLMARESADQNKIMYFQ